MCSGVRGSIGMTPENTMDGYDRGNTQSRSDGYVQNARWSKHATPSPPTGLHGRDTADIAGLHALHKTQNKFRVRVASINLCCAPGDNFGLVAMQPLYLQFMSSSS